METECIARGIENLQLEYGIDTSGNGSANAYITDPTQAELESAVSARIFLLARVSDVDGSFDNSKTYTLSNADDYTPADSIRRRVYITTVAIPNLRNRLILGI
jgi:type IV pilus assembly protein PilW